MFLITFIPMADTIGVGLECVAPWGESIAAALKSEGAPEIPEDMEVFRVTAVPTGDEYTFTVDGALAWVEVMVTAMDSEAAAAAAGEGVEPIRSTRKAPRARKAARGRQAAPGAAQEVTDEAWEASGLEGRPPLPDEDSAAEDEGQAEAEAN